MAQVHATTLEQKTTEELMASRQNPARSRKGHHFCLTGWWSELSQVSRLLVALFTGCEKCYLVPVPVYVM